MNASPANSTEKYYKISPLDGSSQFYALVTLFRGNMPTVPFEKNECTQETGSRCAAKVKNLFSSWDLNPTF
jgi:hypothetical protein